MAIPIHCPQCGEVIASPLDRQQHDVLLSSGRIHDGASVRWSAIASCDARIVGAGESCEDALMALDASADALALAVLPCSASL